MKDKKLFSWALYDWANSAYATIVLAGFYPIIFAENFASTIPDTERTLILGISNGIGSGAMLTLGSDLAPEDSNGPFLGIWRLISWSGSGLASPLVGTIGQFLSLSLASFSITGIGFIGIVFFVFLVPETLRKNHNP